MSERWERFDNADCKSDTLASEIADLFRTNEKDKINEGWQKIEDCALTRSMMRMQDAVNAEISARLEQNTLSGMFYAAEQTDELLRMKAHLGLSTAMNELAFDVIDILQNPEKK